MIKTTAAQPVYATPEIAALTNTTNEVVIKQRISSIDIVRGLVMLIMALDHIRDYFHISTSDPTILQHTTAFLFFTRWITHFCAPAFVLLSGVSAYLAGLQKSKPALCSYLISRGLWLIALDIVVITFAIRLDPFYHVIMLQVICATGISMVILGFLIWAPLPVVGVLGAIIFFCRDIFDTVQIPLNTVGGVMLRAFAGNPFTINLPGNHEVLLIYTILPWAAVMMLGYTLGPVYAKNYGPIKRRRLLITTGCLLMLLFLILRGLNGYGDPAPWSKQPTPLFTLLSFLNTTKYPASLDFFCVTLGPILILLAYAENIRNWFSSVLQLYGNVPLFYYILHFYLARAVSLIIFAASGSSLHDLSKRTYATHHPAIIRFHLGGVYVIWLLIIIALYLPCKWYCSYKRTHTYWWLSYL